ncbi:MAG: PilZ domain-containing protein [Oscillibacter sp.]|nr:PilZ domain-containing protein [Oscillibacter sp.]
MEMNRQDDKLYMLLDSGNTPLAHCLMQGPTDGQTLQVEILGGREDAVGAHEIVELISMGRSNMAYQCKVLRQRGERFALEKLMELDPEVRRNLRVPIRFESFLYPLSGRWKGRRNIRSIDLSCGGIGFFSGPGLRAGERMEVVIPLTDEPLILRCEILRINELKEERVMYAAKFVEMCEDEEVMVRKAVFNIQLQNEMRRADLEEDLEDT